MSTPTRSEIRQAVRTVLERTLAGAAPALASGPPPAAPTVLAVPVPGAGAPAPVTTAIGASAPAAIRGLVSGDDVRGAGRGGVLRVAPGALITPLARDLADELGVRIEESGSSAAVAATVAEDPAPDVPSARAITPGAGAIALGADHGGFELKELIKTRLAARGHAIADLGTTSKESCDYPDFAAAVGRAVALGEAVCGIMVDGAGVGSSIVCNKVPGVRATSCHDAFTAKNSRQHNHANVLCLGSNVVAGDEALGVVEAFLQTPWGGGRYARRCAKVDAIEAAFVGGRR